MNMTGLWKKSTKQITGVGSGQALRLEVDMVIFEGLLTVSGRCIKHIVILMSILMGFLKNTYWYVIGATILCVLTQNIYLKEPQKTI
jgi:hypothetical protein